MEKYEDTSLDFSERAKALVSKMTPEEKCTQMRYDSPAINRLQIMEYNWWNEGLHGVARAGTATVFPQAIALASMFSNKWIQKVAKAIALEARAKYNASSSHGDRGIYKGLTLWSPNVNIFRDPRWGRGHETYGEDPYLTGELGKSFVIGIQGKSKYWMAAACAKHFAVHSGPESLRHGFNAQVSKKDLEETYLPAFRKLAEETDIAGFMGAYNAVNGQPCCANDYLTDLLRNKWGFDGYFVSDCYAIRDFHEYHKVTSKPIESVELAVKHECDLNCGCTYQHLLSAYYKGKVIESQLDKSVERLIRTRFKLGMFDVTELDDISLDVVDSPEHKQINIECAQRSMVLLKNNGILPLDKSKINTIAVIGPNSDRKEALEGNYCGTASGYVTFLQGIQKHFDKRVLYAQGSHLFNERCEPLAQDDDRLSEAIATAEMADVVILCVGLDSSMEGEEGDAGNTYAAGDKLNLRYPQPQRNLIRSIIAVGKPVILVTASGSSMNPETDEDAARIQAWYSGSQGGEALARIIFGEVSPSGKLPVTFYKTADLLPEFADYSMENRTYRFIKNNDNVLYPFGHGLTYGNVCVEKVIWKKLNYGGNICVLAENKGKFDTEDVIQLYMKIKSRDAVRNVSLCGMQRVFLAKGQKKKIIIPVSLEAFTVVRKDGKRYIDADAEYTIFADTKQPDDKSAEIKIEFNQIGKGN
jgi:beta-glucosidase